MCTNMCAYNARCDIPLLVITGLARGSFENKDVTFHQHITHDHNMWHYLYFIVHLRTKDTTEFTGGHFYLMVLKVSRGEFPSLLWEIPLKCAPYNLAYSAFKC